MFEANGMTLVFYGKNAPGEHDVNHIIYIYPKSMWNANNVGRIMVWKRCGMHCALNPRRLARANRRVNRGRTSQLDITYSGSICCKFITDENCV